MITAKDAAPSLKMKELRSISRRLNNEHGYLKLREKLDKHKNEMSEEDIVETKRQIENYMREIRNFTPNSMSYGLDDTTRKAVNLIYQ